MSSATRAFPKMTVTSGEEWIPLPEPISPSRRVKNLPRELSFSFNCAVRFFSLRRALKKGNFAAVRASRIFMARRTREKIRFAPASDFANRFTIDFTSPSQVIGRETRRVSRLRLLYMYISTVGRKCPILSFYPILGLLGGSFPVGHALPSLTSM